MTKVLLIGHGHLPKTLYETAEMIYGTSVGVSYLCFESHHNVDDYLEELRKLCAESKQILVLTDILGGSPFMQIARLSNELKDEKSIEIVTGVNLGMLIEVISQKEGKSAFELSELAKEVGHKGITDLKTWMKR